jgi:hypothetical protein
MALAALSGTTPGCGRKCPERASPPRVGIVAPWFKIPPSADGGVKNLWRWLVRDVGHLPRGSRSLRPLMEESKTCGAGSSGMLATVRHPLADRRLHVGVGSKAGRVNQRQSAAVGRPSRVFPPRSQTPLTSSPTPRCGRHPWSRSASQHQHRPRESSPPHDGARLRRCLRPTRQ